MKLRKVFLIGAGFAASFAALLFLGSGCAHCRHTGDKKMDATNVFHTFRLKPGEDINGSIKKFITEKNIKAGSIVTVVGSLTQSSLRYANKSEFTVIKKDLEIVSFTGTVSINGSHLHMAVSTPTGETFGGHVGDGSIVRTTAEITLVEFKNLNFTRPLEPLSGYKELVVEEASKP